MNKCIIAISHSNYLIKPTGTEKCIRELANVLRDSSVETIQVFSIHNKLSRLSRNQLVGLNYGKEFMGIFTLNDAKGAIANICTKFNLTPTALHLHHFWNYDLVSLSSFIKYWSVPKVLFIHDYYTVCTSITMINSHNQFCGVSRPNETKCSNCSHFQMLPLINSIYQFMISIEPIISTTIVPSHDLYNRWTKVYPQFENKTVVRGHLETYGKYSRYTSPEKRFKIAFIGAQLPLKGYTEWRTLVRSVTDSSDLFEFHYFGNPIDVIPNVINHGVSTARDGEDAMTMALRHEGIDIAFLWSKCAETYSYVYYEASAAGCLVITNPLSGNIAAMVNENHNGIVFNSIEDATNFFLDTELITQRLTDLLVKNSFSPQTLKTNPNLDKLIPDQTAAHYSFEGSCKLRPAKLQTFLYKMKHKIFKGYKR